MTNYITKYESFQTNDLRGVAFTKYNYVCVYVICVCLHIVVSNTYCLVF